MDFKNYPMIKMNNRNFLLGIYPKWHSRLFPESILNNENDSIIKDVSYANSIHKVYLCAMAGTRQLQQGDNILIYRTSDNLGPADYRSVATSVCVVEEYRNINEFSSLQEFKRYCSPYSVFSDTELDRFYAGKRYPHIIKFSYNFPLKRRIIRAQIKELTGLADEKYWGFMDLTNAQLRSILDAGEVNESLIVD